MPRFPLYLVTTLLGLTAQASAAVNLQTLIDRSPFASPPSQAVSDAPTEQSVLEFRGMLLEDGVTTFSVFDAAANKARWLKAGEGESFKVKQFDPATNQLEVEQQGKLVKLGLKPVTIQAGAAVVAAPAGRPNGAPNARPSDTVGVDQRLKTIAEEVRIRRAARNSRTTAAVPATNSAKPNR